MVAHALGNPRLYAGLKGIERNFLAHRADYLDEKGGPAYTEDLIDDQELLLELVDGLSEVEDVHPSLGALYRHANCRERWHLLLQHVKDTGDLRAWDTDPDTTFGETRNDAVMQSTKANVNIVDTDMDKESEDSGAIIEGPNANNGMRNVLSALAMSVQ